MRQIKTGNLKHGYCSVILSYMSGKGIFFSFFKVFVVLSEKYEQSRGVKKGQERSRRFNRVQQRSTRFNNVQQGSTRFKPDQESSNGFKKAQKVLRRF